MSVTVVSLVPWKLPTNYFAGVVPDSYDIPKSDGKIPSVLVVDDARTFIYIAHDRPTLEQMVPAKQLGKSLVEDNIKAFIEIEDGCKPGLFWVEGEWTPKDIQEKFKAELSQAVSAQQKWFMKLIRTGDDAWARFGQHRMISGMQREAAKFLGLDKPWAVDTKPIVLADCPACKIKVDSDALVCKNCRAILKPEEAAKAGIKFAA